MSEPSSAPSSLVNDPSNTCAPPHIASFGGSIKGAPQLPTSLQVEQGTSVTLSWEIAGDADAVELVGADQTPGPGITSLTVTPQADTSYVLHAKNQYGEDQASINISVHATCDVISPHAEIATAGGAIAVVNGDDIYLDPPVRNLPQYDERWGSRQIGGGPKDGNVNWTNNACNISTAAMTLRWFAEDCKAGTVTTPAPAKNDPKIPAEYYSQRLAQVLYPDEPAGRVKLVGGKIECNTIFSRVANYLKNGSIDKPANLAAKIASAKPKGGWLPFIKDLLKNGPARPTSAACRPRRSGPTASRPAKRPRAATTSI